MKKIFLVLIAIYSYNSLLANSSQEFVNLGRSAQENLNEQKALAYYKKALKVNPRNIEALSQSSILCANIGNRSKKNTTRDDYYKASKTYATLALRIEPNNANANFAMAVFYGRKVYTVMFPKSRIALSAKIKKYAEKAVRIQPNHYEALTILGMWHYERATLTVAEKQIVSILGGLPKGSLNEAIQYLEKSKSIAPENITNLLALGNVYKELGKKDRCSKIWSKALLLKNQYQDDIQRKKKIKQRLAKL
jgi:tetratricopeptide (TPR) repeat protein